MATQSFFDSKIFGWEDDVGGMHVLHAQFTLATADGAEHTLHDDIAPVLDRIRRAIPLEIVFVAQLLDGDPVVRPAKASGEVDPAEAEVGSMALGIPPAALRDGRCLSMAVVSKSGREFGTVCCDGTAKTRGVAPASALVSVARMIALLLDRAVETVPALVWESSAAAPLALEPALG